MSKATDPFPAPRVASSHTFRAESPSTAHGAQAPFMLAVRPSESQMSPPLGVADRKAGTLSN